MTYTLGNFSLEELEEKDLELVRRWRNSEHVRKWMFTKEYITPEGQKRWFALRKNRSDLIFSLNEEKIGLAYFFDKDPYRRRCKFGFYIGEEKYQISGLGAVMEYMALDLAFMKWKYDKVEGLVPAERRKIINMHQKFGFRQEETRKDKSVDVVIIGLLRGNWLKVRDNIYSVLQRVYEF